MWSVSPGMLTITSTSLYMGVLTTRMAKIYPFRAWRHNPSAVRLYDVVTQLNDRNSATLLKGNYQRNLSTIVRVTIGRPGVFDAEREENVYTRLASDFSAWRRQEILVQEDDL